MLFRPSADQTLDAIHTMLDAWNAEADRFRHAAIAARKGEVPTSLVVSAAEEAHDQLSSLVGKIDDSLDKMSAGNPKFAELLQVQTTAIALLESVGNYYDILDGFVTEQMTSPKRIVHELAVAAE